MYITYIIMSLREFHTHEIYNLQFLLYTKKITNSEMQIIHWTRRIWMKFA